jgi:hypothetical protein
VEKDTKIPTPEENETVCEQTCKYEEIESSEVSATAQVNPTNPKRIMSFLFAILAICLIAVGCGGYWAKTVCQPSQRLIMVGGNDFLTRLYALVNPSSGAVEFQLVLCDYIKFVPVTLADEPKVNLTSTDGTSVEAQYDKDTGIVSANELPPGNYKMDISIIRTDGLSRVDFLGGESFTIVPGRKYKDTTYLFAKSPNDSSTDFTNHRYLVLDNKTQTIAAKQITAPLGSPVPIDISGPVLPQGYTVPDNEHYLFADLEKDKQNELIIYDDKTRLLTILHWNGKAFEEQSKFQIGGSDHKFNDFPMYLISVKAYNFEGVSFPILGIMTTGGGSGYYPELTLLISNGKDGGYKIIWDATAGDHGNWEICGNGVIMSQDNFGLGAHANDKIRFTQEYQYNGTTFVLVNQYSSTTE